MLRKRLAIAVWVVSVFAGCPRGPQSVLGQVPEGGNAEARQRFGEARARFEQGGADVTPELDVLVKEFPKDPVVPYALLPGRHVVGARGQI